MKSAPPMSTVSEYAGAEPSDSVAVSWPAARLSATHILSVRVVVSAGRVKLNPAPFAPTNAACPSCCRPARTAEPDALGEPSAHENLKGWVAGGLEIGVNWPSPRSGAGGTVAGMSVRLLIAVPPALL